MRTTTTAPTKKRVIYCGFDGVLTPTSFEQLNAATPDNERILTKNAFNFLVQALSQPDTEIVIISKNNPEYIKAMLVHAGMTADEVSKIHIRQAGTATLKAIAVSEIELARTPFADGYEVYMQNEDERIRISSVLRDRNIREVPDIYPNGTHFRLLAAMAVPASRTPVGTIPALSTPSTPTDAASTPPSPTPSIPRSPSATASDDAEVDVRLGGDSDSLVSDDDDELTSTSSEYSDDDDTDPLSRFLTDPIGDISTPGGPVDDPGHPVPPTHTPPPIPGSPTPGELSYNKISKELKELLASLPNPSMAREKVASFRALFELACSASKPQNPEWTAQVINTLATYHDSLSVNELADNPRVRSLYDACEYININRNRMDTFYANYSVHNITDYDATVRAHQQPQQESFAELQGQTRTTTELINHDQFRLGQLPLAGEKAVFIERYKNKVATTELIAIPESLKEKGKGITRETGWRPHDDLIRLAIQMVEGHRQLDPHSDIVLNKSFRPALTAAVILYCKSQGYEVNNRTSHNDKSCNPDQKRVDQFREYLQANQADLGYTDKYRHREKVQEDNPDLMNGAYSPPRR